MTGGYVPGFSQASCFGAFVEILPVDVLPESGGL